jgi:hypothetical protein
VDVLLWKPDSVIGVVKAPSRYRPVDHQGDIQLHLFGVGRFRFGFALVACAPGRGIVASGLTRAISEMASLVESGMYTVLAGFAILGPCGLFFQEARINNSIDDLDGRLLEDLTNTNPSILHHGIESHGHKRCNQDRRSKNNSFYSD